MILAGPISYTSPVTSLMWTLPIKPGGLRKHPIVLSIVPVAAIVMVEPP